jgi:threonine dehydrogenase-like Zn-dependent dehydrogenase
MSECEIVITGPERAELLPLRASEPAPGGALGDNEVEGHTLVSAVSPGTELSWAYTGKNFPAYPGYASVFRVERIGAKVSDIKPGDTVFCMGNHRSFQKSSSNRVVKLPSGLDPAAGVLTRLMNVSMSTLVTTTARPPATIVVSGLGPVGNLAAQIFHACGYRVLACDPVDWRRALLRDTGIVTLPAIPSGDPAYVDAVDLVVDCSGHEGAVLDACKTVRKRGEVVLVGVPWRQRTEITAQALLSVVFHRYVVLRSGWEWELPMDATDFRPGNLMQNLAAGLEWIRSNKIRLDGFANRASPFEAQRVYSELLQQRTQTLTTIFEWDNE